MIGDRQKIPADIRNLIGEAEATTRGNKGLNFIVAFNYGGRDEIVRAARALAERVARNELAAKEIDGATFESALDTVGIPDPDLLIRTSGEMRISNFLLWQAAYAELVFLPVFWPDFGDEHFEAAMTEFASRERRVWQSGWCLKAAPTVCYCFPAVLIDVAFRTHQALQ